MPPVVSASASRLGLALVACIAGIAVLGACHGPDPYYRGGGDGAAGKPFGAGGKGGSPGAAGSHGAAGTGAAGSFGAAGTTGAAGSFGVGAAGTGANMTGAAGTGGPCTTCKVNLQYTCRSNDTNQASFVVTVTNNAAVPIALADLTLRYWYSETGKDEELDCDFAELGCSNQLPPKFVEVLPPRAKANMYVEVGFSPGALTLDPFLDTGEIQLRLHNRNFTPIVQTDDYSFDDSRKGDPVEWAKITVYLKGVLVWGTEPP